MYERFTDRARKVMQLANQEAQRFNHECIGTEHLLLGLLREGAGVAAHVLKNLDIDLRKLFLEIEKIVQPGPEKRIMGMLPQTPRVKQVIKYALEEAENLNHKFIGTEHLLLGLLREEETVAAQVLLNLGLKLEDVREETLLLLGNSEGKEGWERRRQQRAKNQISENIVREENRGNPSQDDPIPSADSERIRSLEQQLRILRFLLAGLVGALVGALLDGGTGAFRGWGLGAIVVLLGEIPAALAGGISGVLLAAAYLPSMGEWVLAGLWGAFVGMFLTDGRGFLNLWRRR
jgi:hypothetical protein